MISEEYLPIVNLLLVTLMVAVTSAIFYIKSATNVSRHEKLLVRALASSGCDTLRHDACWSAPAGIFEGRDGFRHIFRFTATDHRGNMLQGWARTGSFCAGALSGRVQMHWDNKDEVRGKTVTRQHTVC